jgi:hypothetical protein
MKFASRFLILLIPLLFVAAAKKKQPIVAVRFHTEANAHDSSSFATKVALLNPPREAYIEKMPVLSERDIQAIFPFPAADGTMGCAFQFDRHGTLALDTLSIEKRGEPLVPVVNGRQLMDMTIDKRVSDGILTIPRGILPVEIDALQKLYPVIGQPPRKK